MLINSVVKSIEDDRCITLITLSPDIEPLSTAFDLGHELHHYSGADSNMTQWIMKVRETAKIIPFIIGMTARSSLGHTVETQEGAVKHGVLQIYTMAVNNAVSLLSPQKETTRSSQRNSS